MNIKYKKSPLFRLEHMKSGRDGIYYRITIDGYERDTSGQVVFFSSGDYSINFIEPYFPCYRYLLENEKWLRSILYTTLKIKNLEEISIPFSFPEETASSPAPEGAARVYCDGSCSVSGNGGWGGVILLHEDDPVEISGEEYNATSNRMELMAAVNTLYRVRDIMNGAEQAVLLLSDSRYVLLGITHRLNLWMRNGFITSLGTPVINRELWEEMADIMSSMQLHCSRIESGTDDQYHHRCHELAGMRMRREICN